MMLLGGKEGYWAFLMRCTFCSLTDDDQCLRRRCSNVGRFSYKLYAAAPIHIEVKNGFMGYWLLTRFYILGNV